MRFLRQHMYLLLGLFACALAALGIGVYHYYHHVYLPAHEDKRRREARAEWLELAPRRRAEGITVHHIPMQGQAEDAHILLKCFKEGEPAADCGEILATGTREVFESGEIRYEWSFRVPKPPNPDATVFVVTVYVSGDPAVVQFVTGGYTLD